MFLGIDEALQPGQLERREGAMPGAIHAADDRDEPIRRSRYGWTLRLACYLASWVGDAPTPVIVAGRTADRARVGRPGNDAEMSGTDPVVALLPPQTGSWVGHAHGAIARTVLTGNRLCRFTPRDDPVVVVKALATAGIGDGDVTAARDGRAASRPFHHAVDVVELGGTAVARIRDRETACPDRSFPDDGLTGCRPGIDPVLPECGALRIAPGIRHAESAGTGSAVGRWP